MLYWQPILFLMFFRRSAKKIIKEDEVLITLYKESGDLTYLGDLYERYMHLVFGVCLKYLRDKEESKDMTMQIFEKLGIELKKQEVRNFKSWLHVLTKNECLMLIRTAKYKSSKEAFEINEEVAMENSYILHHNGEEGLEKNIQALEKAIQILPSEQKACVKLFYIEQKCYKEITEMTGYDLNKVKSYIQNGKRNLKIHLQKINAQS